MGLGNLRQTAFIIDFGIAKEYWNTTTGTHISFCRGQHLTGTPAFASINSHVGFELGRRDDLESLAYMLIYFLRGCLPWLTDDHEKLSTSSILERKANTSIECLCRGVPSEIASMVIYSRSLAFSEEPDYHYIHSLFDNLRATVPTSAVDSLDFTYPDDATIHTHTGTCPNDPSVTTCRLEAISEPDGSLIHPPLRSNDQSVAKPLRRSTRHV
jgi:serine/threonine protein kinase